MSIFGMMRTSIAGMAVQADRLGAVSDNIANSKTTGYKEASVEFSTLVLENANNAYQSGSVESRTRHSISQQGAFEYTSSTTDLAIKGNGFFVVSDDAGREYLTRAGAFVKDSNGELVNTAGFRLLGTGATGGARVPVNINALGMQAVPSTSGTLTVNLDAGATAVALPSTPASSNLATAAPSWKTSLTAYGDLGQKITLDVFATKTAANTWDVAVFDNAAAPTGGGFPYTSGPLTSATMTFDSVTGALTSAGSLSVTVSAAGPITIDVSKTSQLYADSVVRDAGLNGNAASDVDHVEIDEKGQLYAVYSAGGRSAQPAYQLSMGDVTSPDNLRPLTGNVFETTADSGAIVFGSAGTGRFGNIISNALEQSTVDIASELTTMIETQRNYTANSKVFQVGSELTDVLVNLVR